MNDSFLARLIKGRGGSPANWLADGTAIIADQFPEFGQVAMACGKMSDGMGYLLKVPHAARNVIRHRLLARIRHSSPQT